MTKSKIVGYKLRSTNNSTAREAILCRTWLKLPGMREFATGLVVPAGGKRCFVQEELRLLGERPRHRRKASKDLQTNGAAERTTTKARREA